jgi:hypothetical protein
MSDCVLSNTAVETFQIRMSDAKMKCHVSRHKPVATFLHTVWKILMGDMRVCTGKVKTLHVMGCIECSLAVCLVRGAGFEFRLGHSPLLRNVSTVFFSCSFENGQ